MQDEDPRVSVELPGGGYCCLPEVANPVEQLARGVRRGLLHDNGDR